MLDAHRIWAASDLLLRYLVALQLGSSDIQRDSFTPKEWRESVKMREFL